MSCVYLQFVHLQVSRKQGAMVERGKSAQNEWKASASRNRVDTQGRWEVRRDGGLGRGKSR